MVEVAAGDVSRQVFAAGLEWSTLTVSGPTTSRGAHGVTWFEWGAAVEAR